MALIMMQAITGDSVLLKFEKAKCALEDILQRCMSGQIILPANKKELLHGIS